MKYLISLFYWEGILLILWMYIVLGYLKVLLDNGWLSKFGINIYVYVFLNLMFEIYELRFKWKCGIFIGENLYFSFKIMGGEKGKKDF